MIPTIDKKTETAKKKTIKEGNRNIITVSKEDRNYREENLVNRNIITVDKINRNYKEENERRVAWGNTRSAALRRLHKDRPDLLEKVMNKEMSANEAMVEAGFRQNRRITKYTYLVPLYNISHTLPPHIA